MLRNFNFAAGLSALRAHLPVLGRGAARDSKTLLRVALGLLLVANLAAAILIFHPMGGSPQDMDEQLRSLRTQLQQRQSGLTTLRRVAAKVGKGRDEGAAFMDRYFLAERVASSAILAELNSVARESKMKVKEHTFSVEPIEGSNDLNILTINGNYEGSYGNLMEFVNLLDRSKQLIIIESLQAQPQQTAGILNLNIRLETFVREARTR